MSERNFTDEKINLCESSQFGLRAHGEVKGQGDVDGNHGHRVNDVQWLVEELGPVRGEQQPGQHLQEKVMKL